MRTLAIISILAIAASLAVADPVSQIFYSTKDSAFDEGNRDCNQGAVSSQRAAKNPSMEDCSLYGFDKAGMLAFVNANGGWGNLQSATFNLTPSGTITDNGKGIWVGAIHSLTDWAEGNGSGSLFGSFNWTGTTVAAVTHNYAQEYWIYSGTTKVADTVNSIPWTDLAGNPIPHTNNTDGFNALPVVLWNNGKLTESGTATPDLAYKYRPFNDLVYNSVPLDSRFIQDLVTNDNNRGIRLWDKDDINGNENWMAYFKEYTGTSRDPYIEITLIPEPATLSLVTMGAVSLLMRKRRRAQ